VDAALGAVGGIEPAQERALLRRWLHSVAPRAVEGRAETFDALIADTKSLLEGVAPAPEPLPEEEHECEYEHGDGACPKCVALANVGARRVAPAQAREPAPPEPLTVRLLTQLLLESNSWEDGVKLPNKFTHREARLLSEWIMARFAVLRGADV
jgi:hypothetical protein